jgi:transposase InsO family protein/transposase-like protein
MKQNYGEDQKRDLVGRYHTGVSVASLCTEMEIPSSTFYSWIRLYRPIIKNAETTITLKDIDSLKRKTEKLENMVQILKTVNCTTSSPLKDKLDELELLYGQFSVHALCEALDVPRGTFYNHILRNKRNNTLQIKRREDLRIMIREVFDENRQIFGAGKIRAILLSNGCHVSEKMVAELMSEMGLHSIRTTAKRNYNRLKQQERKRNVLQRNFHAEECNRVWVSDITCFKLKGKYYYICIIIDLFSRKVVAHNISLRNSTRLVSSTFKQAYAERKPSCKLLFHSDRGTQYSSHSFQKLLRDYHTKQSFSNAGKPHDNAVAESFFASMKLEELYRTNYRSEVDLRNRVSSYIVFYNSKRPHDSLFNKTPDQCEATSQKTDIDIRI